MLNMYQIQPNDQLYVNNKWYFDVLSLNNSNLTVRIKYYETPQQKYVSYRNINLPINIFQDCIVDNFIVICKIYEPDLKQYIGGLINRLIIEPNVLTLLESSIMEDIRSVSDPGLSGISGQIGTLGSGDIGNSLITTQKLPNNEFGLEITNKKTLQHHRKASKKNHEILIKKPIITLSEQNIQNSDADYKTLIYTFLDYPTDNLYDIKIQGEIEQYRSEIEHISSERLIQYFQDLYTINKSLIDNKCSDWLISSLLNLTQ